ncbi:hypothetical protein EAG_06559 [Camponotus floridanus]|uniref:Uncharacterized protein n=1 Tax=Camponotus floridanus TaxID=104421 RepID=E2AMI4_CAMFO|nr:hypothetical protein EAG_06559 [Camponotus floridanus]
MRIEKIEDIQERSSNLDDNTTTSENLPPLPEEITVRKRTRPAPVLSGRWSNEATAGPPAALSPLRGTSASRSPHSGKASLKFRPRKMTIAFNAHREDRRYSRKKQQPRRQHDDIGEPSSSPRGDNRPKKDASSSGALWPVEQRGDGRTTRGTPAATGNLG